MDIVIAPDDPGRADIARLLSEHLGEMFETSPPESVHALDIEALTVPSITFARDPGGVLLGIGAIKDLGNGMAELKSMRTTYAARRRGVAAALVAHLVDLAWANGCDTICLETGSQDYFSGARALYQRSGFTQRGPFGEYIEDPSSVFFELVLPTPQPTSDSAR